MTQGSVAPDLGKLKIDEHARGGRVGPRWWLWGLVLFVLIVAGSGAFYAVRSKAAVVEVSSARAVSANTPTGILNASGYITPRLRATVAAKITGRVTHVFIDEGVRVQVGQILAKLDDSDAKVRLASAIADRDATAALVADLQVNLTNAERELHRTESLQHGGVSSQQALDDARTTAESLRAKLASTREQIRAYQSRIAVAQQDLDNCTVRAPFGGIVVSKDAQVGEIISPISAGGGFTRTGIATIVDMNSIEVEVDVNESYIARVREHQPAYAVLDAYPDWQIPAKVRTVIPTADRQKATVKVRLTFDKLDPKILPDMGVKVTFLDDQPKQQNSGKRIEVPHDAVRTDAGQTIVFIYRDGRVERRAVSAGGTHGTSQEILAGLNEGDQVVISGFDGLKDGAAVDLKK